MGLLYKIRAEGEFQVYTLSNSRTWLFIGSIVIWFVLLALGYYQMVPDTVSIILIVLDSLILLIGSWELRLLNLARANASSKKKVNGKNFTEIWVGSKI